MYKFSKRSLNNLKGIDARLVVLFSLMLDYSPFDFIVTEGLRTIERQKQLLIEGKSTTMNSRHLKGGAVDVVLLVQGKVNWDISNYKLFSIEVKKVAKKLGFKITWGGDWKSFIDGPHFQIEEA